MSSVRFMMFLISWMLTSVGILHVSLFTFGPTWISRF